MLTELKYAARPYLSQRVIAIAATIVLNLIFGLCGGTGVYGYAGNITAVALSALALCAVFVVNVIADLGAIRTLFCAPAGYFYALTPQPRWRVLLSRVIFILVWDNVTLYIALAGLLVQTSLLVNASAIAGEISSSDVWLAVLLALYYALVLLAVFFAAAIAKGPLFRAPGRGFLGFLVFCAVIYAHSLLNLVLTPLSSASHYGVFTTITIQTGANAGMIGFLILLVAELVALFCATAYLMERKVNL